MKRNAAETGDVRVERDESGCVFARLLSDEGRSITLGPEDVPSLVRCLAAVGFPVMVLDDTPKQEVETDRVSLGWSPEEQYAQYREMFNKSAK